MMHFLRTIVCCLAFIPALSAQNLIGVTYLQSISQSALEAEYGPLMENGVDLYKVLYTTPDLQGVTDTASGLMVIPDRPFSAVPLISVQHGTVASRENVPSNLQGGYELGVVFGAQGYVVSYPDLLGLGESRGFHPYVHAASEASAAIDMLYAMRQYPFEDGISLNDQLFITGYSQGGHSAAAVQKVIQESLSDDFTITAAAPLSGPYSLSVVMKEVMTGDEAYFYPSYLPNVVLSFNTVYNIFDDIEEYFIQPYADRVEAYFNEEIDLNTLNNDLINLLEANEGASVAKFMLQDSILNALENDPDHITNVALRENDLYDWVPEAPTRLIYCTGDDQVSFRNAVVADSVMNLNGAPDVLSIDIDPPADHNECVVPAVTAASLFFNQFKEITVSTNEILRPEGVAVYPNPATEVLYIKGLNDRLAIEWFNLNGQKIKQSVLNASSGTIKLNDLPKGMYMLRFTTKEYNWTEKLIVD